MNYKQLTQEAYDKYAKEFEKNTIPLFEATKARDTMPFLTNLNGKRILDLGSGPGVHSLYFKQQGLHPICLDTSIEMARLCKQKDLDTLVGDLESPPFQEDTFHGVWACASLLHIPKSNLPRTLENIKRILSKEGVLYISVKEGSSEGETESDKYPGVKRFFALYQEGELREMLQKYEILHSSKNQVRKAIFLNYVCRVRQIP